MAKEYIDREAALTAIKVHCPASYEAEMLARIVCIPAADVVEVRHGRWKPHSKVEVPVFHCSVCGGAALHAFGKQCKSPYCPNCGAKMEVDGE